MLNNKGYTLIETLLVLGITALLLGLPSLSLTSFSDSLEERLFFNELDAQISHIQTYAIVNNVRTQLEIQPLQNQIKFHAVGFSENSTDQVLVLPENMSVSATQRNYSFSPGFGNIDRINTITFDSNQAKTIYTFQLGSGRYNVAKTPK